MKLTATLKFLECRNDRCKYYINSSKDPRNRSRWNRWVQINADGTIPVRQGGESEFSIRNLTQEQQSALDDNMREFYERTIKKDGEAREYDQNSW
jgi:hypothetical protein